MQMVPATVFANIAANGSGSPVFDHAYELRNPMAKAEKANHIMVINDVPELVDVLRQVLEDANYRVTVDTFSDFDLEVMFANIVKVKPDALVLDLIMGGEMIGWQLLQRIKLDRTQSKLPIVLCTAAARQIGEIGAHLRTMNVAVILKPFDIDALLDAVAQSLVGGPKMGLSIAEPS